MYLSFFFVSCANPTPSPSAYTAEECALARAFEASCQHRNDAGSVDENGNSVEFPNDMDLDDIVARRKALRVSNERHWWCSEPKSKTDYKYEARFNPPIDSCGVKSL